VVPAGGATLLTLTASPSAGATTNTTVSITGSSGTVSNSFSLALGVQPNPSFTVTAVPASQSVPQGYSGVIKVSVVGNGSVPGGVALQVNGLPPNTTAAYGQAASGALTMTVATTKLTPLGSYPITITGILGSVQQSATATLNVTH